MSEVEQAWDRIVAWCEYRAPRTAQLIRPPAPAAELAQAETSTGGHWPEELREWYRLQDGVDQGPASYLFPGYAPLSLAELVRTWTMYREVMTSLVADGTLPDAVGELERQEAGEVAWMFLPSYVPIASTNAATDVFVDLRPGARSGCVREYLREDADRRGVRWDSVGAMLADVADSLERRRRTDHWLPAIEDGRLDWEVVSAAEAARMDQGWDARDDRLREQPEDLRAAEDGIRAAFTQALTGGGSPDEVLAAVESGAVLADALDQARRLQPTITGSVTVEVVSVMFLDAVRADVSYRLQWSSGSGPDYSSAGLAVLTDGVWKVSRHSYCEVLRLAGASC